MIRTILFILSVGIAISAFPQNESWSKSSKKAFSTECVMGAKESIGKELAKDYCQCMLDKIIVEFPDPTDVDKLTEELTNRLAKECLGLEVEWPNESKDAFTVECVSGAKESVGEELAIEYCQCMLIKVMALYPNPLDADGITEEEMIPLVKECMGLE